MKNLILLDEIMIDSDYRSSGTRTNFIIDIPSERNIKAIKIVNLLFPLFVPTIISPYNTFTIGGILITVPEGSYDIYTLVTKLNELCGSDYLWERTAEKRLKVSSTIPAAFTLLQGTMNNSDNNILGFIPLESGGSYTGQTSYTGSYAPDLTISDYFTLHSSFLSNQKNIRFHHSDKRADLLLMIPNIEAPLSMLSYTNQTTDDGIIVFGEFSKLTSLDFQLKNDLNQIVGDYGKAIHIHIRRYTYV